jgi:ATP-binding cassette subfamily B protein
MLLALLSNGINLILPKVIANAMMHILTQYVLLDVVLKYMSAALIIFIFTWAQGLVQVYASEKVAKDLRSNLSQKISRKAMPM